MARSPVSHLGCLAALLLWPAPAPAATVDLELVSGRPFAAGDPANGRTRIADVSADGRFALLRTSATNLAAQIHDDNGAEDLVVFDHRTQEAGWVTLSGSRPGHSLATNDSAVEGELSDDGRYVAFTSSSHDVPGLWVFQGSTQDVYLFDRAGWTTTLVTRHPGTSVAAGGQFHHLSADGRWVLYSSGSDSLIAGGSDTNGRDDLFLFDRTSGQSRLVSARAGSSTDAGNGGVGALSALSEDGRFVLYLSTATDLVPSFVDGNGPANADLFLFDREIGVNTLVTHAPGLPATGAAGAIALDEGGGGLELAAGGDYAFFGHRGGNLVPGFSGPPGGIQLYRFELASGALRLVTGVGGSASSGANGDSQAAALSSDGRFLLFTSRATNLYSGFVPNGARSGLFLADLAASTLLLVNHPVGLPDTPACCQVKGHAVSGDGRYVLYYGSAAGVAPDQLGDTSVFLFDRQSGATRLLSHLPGLPGFAVAGEPAGGLVAERIHLQSEADLVGDAPAWVSAPLDAYAVERRNGAVSRISSAAAPGVGAGQMSIENIAFHGADLVFHSEAGAGDLSPGAFDGNSGFDPFLYRIADGSRIPLLAAADDPGRTPNGGSQLRLLPSGAALAYTLATDLAAGIDDRNEQLDVYLGGPGDAPFRLVSSVFGQPATAAGDAQPPLATPSGHRVAFSSRAGGLSGTADGNGSLDVFLWQDDGLGGSRLISRSIADPGRAANGHSLLLGLADDGGTLLFESQAGDLVADFVDHNDSSTDLYLYRAGVNTLLTRQRPGAGNPGSDGWLESARLAADGSAVIFSHAGAHLVPGVDDRNGAPDLFAYDVATGETRLAVHAVGDRAATPAGMIWLEAITPDGRFALFSSGAPNVTAGPLLSPGSDSCYLLDRRLGKVFLISHPAGDPAAKATGKGMAISPDGRYVVFASPAPDLVAGQAPATATLPPVNLFLHDRATGERLLLTHLPDEPLRPGGAGEPSEAALAGDGSRVAFTTTQSGLVADDPGGRDLFLARVDRGGLIFSDGFELGDSSLWSATAGGN